MSNHEQLFTEMLPNEEANLSGGGNLYDVKYPLFLSQAEAKADSAAVGGFINQAQTKTTTITAPGVALSSSHSKALTIG